MEEGNRGFFTKNNVKYGEIGKVYEDFTKNCPRQIPIESETIKDPNGDTFMVKILWETADFSKNS